MAQKAKVFIPPLAKEEPVLFRPTLAQAFGPAAAALLEKAHALQCLLGRGVSFQHQGRAVERTIFPWSTQDRERLPGWSPRQVRRIFRDLAGSADLMTVNPRAEVLLWQHSARDEDGVLSRDWFSVNYEAVGRACPTVSVHLSAGLLDPAIHGGAEGGSSGQNVQEVWTLRPESADEMSKKFGQNVRGNPRAHLSNSSLNSLTLSLPPSARAREALAILQSGGAAAAGAVDALVALGFDALDAAGLIGRWPDGAERARVMAANVELLRAAGPDYFQPWPPRGYVVKGMREAWPALTAAEAAGRVAAHRARATATTTRAPLTTGPVTSPAVSKDEALRQRIEAAGRRL